MKNEDIKTIINSSTKKIFYITAAFIMPAALMIATGHAKGSLSESPALYTMLASGFAYVLTLKKAKKIEVTHD